MKSFTQKINRLMILCIILLNFSLTIYAIPPILSNLENSDLTFTEGSLSINVTNNIQVFDFDGLSPAAYAIVTIKDNYLSTEDRLSLTGGPLSGSFTLISGELIISGPGNETDFQQSFRNVKYQNINTDNPSTNQRTLTFQIIDGFEISNELKRGLNINAVNDKPVTTNPGTTIFSYTEGSAAIDILPIVTVSDVDDPTLTQATVKITNNVNPEDILTISGSAIPYTWDVTSGTMTFSGTYTLDDYQKTLRKVKYLNGNNNKPDTKQRTIQYRVKDQTLESDIANVYVNVTGVNDVPVLGGANGTITYTEGNPYTVVANAITISDVDNDSLTNATINISTYVTGEDRLQVSVSAPLTSSFEPIGGVLTISGKAPLSQYQAALRNVQYRNLNDTTPNTSTRVVYFQVNDGTSASNTIQQNILVQAVNDAPTALNDVYIDVAEGGTLTVNAANGVLKNDSDPDGPSALTAQIGTSTAFGTLTLNANGSFTYIHNGSENLVDGFTYRAFDSQAQSNLATVQITMNGQNDAPVLSGIESTPISFTEGNAGTTVSSSITVVDSDNIDLSSAIIQITSNYLSTEDSLYYTPVGPTVTYNKSNGSITLTGTYSVAIYQSFLRSIKYKNYNKNNPSTSFRQVTFTVNDGTQNSNTQSRQINIEAVNDSCEATNVLVNGSNFLVGEKLNLTYTYSDPDGDPEGATTLRWYTSANATGLPMTMLPGITTDTFTIRNNEGGKYIGAIVRPFDNKGLAGYADTSVFHYVNAAPTFTDTIVENLVHPGSFAVGETVTAKFTYSDKEGNSAGTHQYQWYRSDSAKWTNASPIGGATGLTYVIKNIDKDKFLAFKALPLATSGSSPGRFYSSMWYSVSLLPSASLSGVDSICNQASSQGVLMVSLTSSNPPVTFVYQRNSSTPVSISTSDLSVPYPLTSSDTGTYKLLSISDNKYSYGTKLDSIGKIIYYPKPTATISLDSVKLCSSDTGTYNIPVNLTGKAPWSLTYRRNGTIVKTETNLNEPVYNIKVKATAPGLYTVTNVTGGNGCTATVTGQCVVTVKTSPIAAISGNLSICPYSTAPIDVNLTGTSPWLFYYKVGDGPEIQVTTSESNYKLDKSDAGTYRLTRVFDASNKEGCVSGTATVTHYPVPTASISGTYSTCEGTNATINVQFTGTANWEFAYSLDGGTPVVKSDISQATYPLAVNKKGNYTIASVSDAHCQGTFSGTANLSIIPAPKVDISMDETFYAKDALPAEIYISHEGGSFSASSKPQSIVVIDDVIKFWPYIAGTKDSPHMIRYKYQDSGTQCWGYDSLKVYVVQDSSGIIIENGDLNEKDTLCFNYDTLLIKGYYLGGISTFGNFTTQLPSLMTALENLDSNRAYIFPSKLPPGVNVMSVNFNYYVGTTKKVNNKTFKFEILNADFAWDNDCFYGTSRVKFSDSSTIDDGKIIDHHYWKINSKEYDAENITVIFNNLSTYPIEYTVESRNGCANSKVKELVLLPTYYPHYNAYYEDFSDGESSWSVKNMLENDTINNWVFGRPLGGKFNAPAGSKAWYTSVTEKYNKDQISVESPCFNFSNTVRPMIKMDIWRAFTDEANIDGSVLQYWTPETSWKTIGQKEDGINWYNNTKEIEGTPGDQNNGWTGAGTNLQDTGWVDCRHALDVLKGKPYVKFRIAYGAKEYNFTRNGIAFDNIWIGERTKKVLIEHFTNAGSQSCNDANSKLNLVVNKKAVDVIDLQYHMDWPGADTFNILNPVTPYSRAYYYDLPDVPYAYMNGGTTSNDIFNFDSKRPEEDDISLAVLEDNNFLMYCVAEIKGDILDINIDIKAIKALSQRQITLHAVVIENEVKGITGDNGETVFESVVREDLNTGSSETSFNQNWVVGSTKHIDLEWPIANVFNPDELRVVAFLQDEQTRKVYQAVLDNPNTENGIWENKDIRTQSFVIYPNPSSGLTSVNWESPIEKDCRMEITDNLGRIIWQGKVLTGQQNKIISLDGLDAGTYVLRVTSDGITFETQKIILLSNN